MGHTDEKRSSQVTGSFARLEFSVDRLN